MYAQQVRVGAQLCVYIKRRCRQVLMVASWRSTDICSAAPRAVLGVYLHVSPVTCVVVMQVLQEPFLKVRWCIWYGIAPVVIPG